MDDPEYVETSDPEELEIVHGMHNVPVRPSTARTSSPGAPTTLTPRKRRKLFHDPAHPSDASDEMDESFERQISRNIDDGSPVRPSPGLPTSTAVSDDELQDPIEITLNKDPSMINGMDGGLLSADAVSMDIGFESPVTRSQDELDVIAQPLSQINLFLGDMPSPSNSKLVILQSAPLAEEHRKSKCRVTTEQETPSQPSGLLSLFSPRRDSFLSSRSIGLNDESAKSASPRSSGVRTIAPPRFSSLPPSSPPSASISVINTPLRSQSHSPDHTGPIQSRSIWGQNAEDRQLLAGDEEKAFHFDSDDVAPRRYSLRARQAWQLNPYEYDKLQYKKAMRRNPDAMIKVVSPRRHSSEHVQRHRETEYDDDFVVTEDDDESQEAWRRASKRRRSSEALRESYQAQQESLTWLPGAFHMSDDDLAPLSPLLGKENPSSAAKDPHRSHKSHKKGVHKFPLKQARERNGDDADRDVWKEAESIQTASHSAITYKRRKDIQSDVRARAERSNDQITPLPETKLRVSSRPPFQHDSFESDNAAFDDLGNGFPNEGRYAIRTSMADEISYDSGSYDVEDLDNDGDASHLPHNESQEGTNAIPQPISDSDTDDSDAASELQGLPKNQARALKRMMPRIMYKKLMKKPSVPSMRSTHQRFKSATGSAGDDSESDRASVAPGRSKVTKRSRNSRANRQIIGDSESSESELGVDLIRKTPGNVVNVESSSDSESSAMSSLNEEIDDEVLANSILDAGYFDHDFSRQPIPRRREEPLFDMMLCRTRAKKTSSRRKPKTPGQDVSSKIGDHSLRSSGLDVRIPKPSKQPRLYHERSKIKQTRLQFESAAGYASDYNGENVIDLTNLDFPVEGFAEAGRSEPIKRLTKRKRREAVQKATLHTIFSHDKKIGNGRKKGFMTVQIDMADDGLRNAIKPLRSDSPLHNLPAFGRTPSAKFEHTTQRTCHRPRHDDDNKSTLKQTSLRDFVYDGASALDTFEYAGPKRRPESTQAAADWHDEDRVRTCTLDMGISVPTPGLSFGAGTFLGKQLLPDLFDCAFRDGILPPPSPYEGFGLIKLGAEMTCGCFVEAVDVTCNMVSEWLDDESTESTDDDNVRRYEHLMRSVCQFAAWVYTNTDGEGRKTVQTATLSCATRLIAKIQEKEGQSRSRTFQADPRCLVVMWFNVELSTRMVVAAQRRGCESDTTCWRGSVTSLIKCLMRYGVEKALKPIELREMSSSTVPLRAAELWVCMIHLLPQASCLLRTPTDSNGTFWSAILQTIKEEEKSAMSNIEVSEHLWRLIFGLCALSHFSVHGIATSEPRLSPCWDIVGLALDTIRLTHDKTQDSKVPRESLKRRDKYVRMVVARCFILGTKWRWPLRDANTMFKKLVDIFRSRNFGNLLGEESDFPAFMRYQNIAFFDELRASDTAFGLYLKLVMQATKADPNGDTRAKARTMKLLSLVVPLSGVAFSRTNPPTTSELSMLMNRFSASIVAVLVDEKDNTHVHNRVNQARRFISFDNADDRSRDMCITAAMYMCIAVNHLSLDLTEPLEWLGEMCQTLLTEFQNTTVGLQKEAGVFRTDGSQQHRYKLVMSLHFLLRCVTSIIEKPNMGIDNSSSRYPNVGLINGPWVKRIFPMKELTNIVSTRFLILRLVQSFLKARERVIPPPRRPAPVAISEDNSESQDLFEQFDLDDDVLANLPMDNEAEDIWKKDREVAEIMKSDIIPNIFRLLLQYFNDPTARPADESKLEDYWSNADDWIDCWVSCAAITVRNEKRTWDHYLDVGPTSWSGLGDSFFRRRVAICFMHQLLKCDPTAYNKDYERHFFSVLLQGLIAYRATMEHKYLSTLLSLDGFRHPLLREIPVDKSPEQEDVHISRADFLQLRETIISRIFFNLDVIMQSDTSEHDKNVLVECVLEMLAAMEDIWRGLSSVEDHDKYGRLCQHVFSVIRKYPHIHGLRRLSTYIAWGDGSFGEPLVA